MAFEGLSEKLQNALKKMTGRGRLTRRRVALSRRLGLPGRGFPYPPAPFPAGDGDY